MRISIIVFSPTGNTLKVGHMLQDELCKRDAVVQLIDTTRNATIFTEHQTRAFFEANLAEHDVLVVGGPVYFSHMQYHLLEMLRQLPSSNHKWGKLAVLFTTFGAVSAGQALLEAAEAIRQSGRTPVMGMDINGLHSLSKKWGRQVNADLPGEEALAYVVDLAEGILALEGQDLSQIPDISSKLSVQTRGDVFKNKLIQEKMAHKKLMPTIKFDYNRCTQCNLCIENCPVQCIELKDVGPVQKDSDACIHCANCVNTCPCDAIHMDLKLIEPYILVKSKGGGPHAKAPGRRNYVYKY